MFWQLLPQSCQTSKWDDWPPFAILQDGRRSSVWRLRLSFSVWDADCWRRRRQIGPVQYVGSREAGEHLCAHCFPQPVVSRTITNTSKQRYFTSVGRETDREYGYIRHRWLPTRPADYLRRVTAELLYPDRVSYRQRSVLTRRQWHVCSLDRLITSTCP